MIYFLSWVGLSAVVEPDPSVILVESAAFSVLDADELDQPLFRIFVVVHVFHQDVAAPHVEVFNAEVDLSFT